MADGTKVGSAYVEVTPKAAGNFKSDFEKQMPDGKAPGKKFGGGFASAAKIGIGGLAVAAGNILANVATSAVSGLTDTFKQSFENYANFEQLTGGVEKLFGDEAAKTVMANAEKAFQTAGMSANQYMEQATSFSASLINSLGGDTKKAAELTDVAMRAMSDNVNVFGSNMGDVQNAFQGFAKQNYTMLDNLKLGYGGTKQEMERLIADANEYAAANGEAADLSIDSFADIVQAIQLVQEKQGVAGTTAKEAASTVEGSVNSMKAAWENWLTALGRDDVDLNAVTDQLIQSIETAASNAIPLAARIVESMGETFVAYAPVLFDSALVAMQQISLAAPEVLPQVVAGILTLVSQAAFALVSGAPQLIAGAFQMMGGIIAGILYSIPSILATAVQLIPQLAFQLVAGAGQMLGAALAMFLPIGEALNSVGEELATALYDIVTHLPEIVMNAIGGIAEAGAAFFQGLVDGFLGTQPQVEGAASEVTDSAVKAAEENADASGVGENLTESMATAFDASKLAAEAEASTAEAVDAAAKSADAAPVAIQMTDTAAAAIDMTAMNANAEEMVNNAIEAAKSVDASSIGKQLSEQAADGIDTSAMNSTAEQLSKNLKGLDTTATVSVKADLSGVNQLNSAASSVTSTYNALSSTIAAAMAKASSAATTAANSVRSSIASIPSSKTISFTFSTPHIPVPHYSISGSLDPKSGRVPTVNAYWAAEGGIFTKATIFGAGEAGPEAVLPLDKLPRLLGLDKRRGEQNINVYLQYDASADAEQITNDIARALGRKLAMEA